MKKAEPPDKGEIVLYRADNKKTRVEVHLKGETVWLSLNQMETLFQRDKSVISRHLNNVFRSGELSRKAVVAFFATTAADGKTYQVEYYNLDAIISVGYRVNSKRGTQFRIWATQTLKDHLIQGYTLNERRLRERGIEFEHAIQLLSHTLTSHELVSEQGRAVLEVITRYAKTWSLLKRYDDNRLAVPEKRRTARVLLDYPRAKEAISTLKKELIARGEATPLFGQERSQALSGILGSIEQTFDGKPLYTSAEEKASHLLYFIIKDHPFTDGNKRIGSFLFIIYLRENGCLEDSAGRVKLNDNALVALALLIAESDPAHKDLMTRLVMNLLAEEAT